MVNVTIGSDPEFGAVSAHGNPVSAIGFIPGSKKKPFQLEGEFSVQLDNVGVETCIPICRTKEEFVYAILHSKHLAEKELQKRQPNWRLQSVSSARYSEEELDNVIATTFGCEPSFTVYTNTVSPRPSAEEVGNLRSFGFHIHIGYELEEGEDALEIADKLIRAMDITCGLPSIILDQDKDRRSIYGNAGDLRFRQIENINIVEYRTLGGALTRDEETIGFIFDQTMKAVEMARKWNDDYHLMGRDIQNAIDNGDEEKCIQLMSSFPEVFSEEFIINLKQAYVQVQ